MYANLYASSQKSANPAFAFFRRQMGQRYVVGGRKFDYRFTVAAMRPPHKETAPQTSCFRPQGSRVTKARHH
jgi:hypothetical protein